MMLQWTASNANMQCCVSLLGPDTVSALARHVIHALNSTPSNSTRTLDHTIVDARGTVMHCVAEVPLSQLLLDWSAKCGPGQGLPAVTALLHATLPNLGHSVQLGGSVTPCLANEVYVVV